MRRYASLRRPGDFARVRSRGRRTATADLTVFLSDAVRGDQRAVVGISVSKSVGKAVVRNRVRRRIGAAVHEVLAAHARVRALIVARPSAAAASFEGLRAQLQRALV
ncbi:MAG: ribonuclease P protein component [Candidatus Baltobacteraceae bacterium]